MARRFPLPLSRAVLLAAAIAAAPAWAEGPAPLQTVTISRQDCARLVRHVPDADVAYQPGVDVRGRKVAPADLDPAAADFARRVVPETLEIPLKINPINYRKNMAGTDVTRGLGKAFERSDTTIGVVKYDFRTNSFTYNDQPMIGDDQRALAEACAQRGAR